MSEPASNGQGVLVVDDEKNIRTTLAMYLEQLGYEVSSADGVAAAMDALRCARFDLAFVDLKLRGESALDLIPRLIAESPELLIVLMTADATAEEISAATARGAWLYLPKPFSPKLIRTTVDRATAARAGR